MWYANKSIGKEIWSEVRRVSSTNSINIDTIAKQRGFWRPMHYNDIKKVHSLSLIQWGSEYYESNEIIQNKFDFYPNGCYIYEKDFKVQGYVISYPWSKNIIPSLNEYLDEKTEKNSYYIDDIVLIPDVRGTHLADEIIQLITENKPSVCLIAVPFSTQHYWEKIGFKKTGIPCDYGVHMEKNKLI